MCLLNFEYGCGIRSHLLSFHQLLLQSLLCVLHVQPALVKTIALETAAAYNYGMAVSADGAHMVVSHNDHTLSVYALPGGKHLHSFGGKGSGPSQFDYPAKLCFYNGSVLVAENWNKRIQEVKLTGEHVRFIGAGTLLKRGAIGDGICAIAANSDVIAVAKHDNTSNNRVVVFAAESGRLLCAFGEYGSAPGKLMKYCNGLRISKDGNHIIVCDNDRGGEGRVSVFTMIGEFIKCIGNDSSDEARLLVPGDVEVVYCAGPTSLSTPTATYLVCDMAEEYQCISVFSRAANGGLATKRWGRAGGTDSGIDSTFNFHHPVALALHGPHLYVLDSSSKRVQVFEGWM